MSRSAQITTPGDVREFLLAGNATLTLVSRKTGARFTYRVRVPEDQAAVRDDPKARKVYFVSLLTGADNENSYTYIGQIFSNAVQYSHGKKSRISVDAPGVQAFDWFARMVLNPAAPALPAALEVWHEGRCGRCGRLLTVPESVARGIGPECAGKMTAAWVQPELPALRAVQPDRVTSRQVTSRRGEKFTVVKKEYDRPFDDPLPPNMQFPSDAQ